MSYDGKMVSDGAHMKMTYRGSEVCDKLDDRGYFGEKYTVFDENGKRVSLQTFANLVSVGTSTEYRAFMFYPALCTPTTFKFWTDGRYNESGCARRVSRRRDRQRNHRLQRSGLGGDEKVARQTRRVVQNDLRRRSVSTYKDAIVVGWTDVRPPPKF